MEKILHTFIVFVIGSCTKAHIDITYGTYFHINYITYNINGYKIDNLELFHLV